MHEQPGGDHAQRPTIHRPHRPPQSRPKKPPTSWVLRLGGTCRVRICAGKTSRLRNAFRTNGDRALHGQVDEISVYRLPMRPPLAQSAWSTPSPLPPNDHADCATLGRQRRTRRPGMRDGSQRDSGKSQTYSPILRAGRPHHNATGPETATYLVDTLPLRGAGSGIVPPL